MIKQLTEYVSKKGVSVSLRIFRVSKPRFNSLQQQLTIDNGGVPFSQAQVMEYLLDLAEEKTNC